MNTTHHAKFCVVTAITLVIPHDQLEISNISLKHRGM